MKTGRLSAARSFSYAARSTASSRKVLVHDRRAGIGRIAEPLGDRRAGAGADRRAARLVEEVKTAGRGGQLGRQAALRGDFDVAVGHDRGQRVRRLVARAAG